MVNEYIRNGLPKVKFGNAPETPFNQAVRFEQAAVKAVGAKKGC